MRSYESVYINENGQRVNRIEESEKKLLMKLNETIISVCDSIQKNSSYEEKEILATAVIKLANARAKI